MRRIPFLLLLLLLPAALRAQRDSLGALGVPNTSPP